MWWRYGPIEGSEDMIDLICMLQVPRHMAQGYGHVFYARGCKPKSDRQDTILEYCSSQVDAKIEDDMNIDTLMPSVVMYRAEEFRR